MKVKVRAKVRLRDLEKCIKEAALRAVVDEVTRISGDFVEELFHPGFWERLKDCIGPETGVEVSSGGKTIEKGDNGLFYLCRGRSHAHCR
ncbi:hypothetical protein [Pyrococcus kukulkanii]|uniref:Uncharacterized protein n=1 Tax=Pyrococcus kukulkanii TaxID=1609559 RepID=A0A127BC33_9EURY|nr:hypothetical protein [Pyrococcus kukulkanii]AMM54891.1 hypothetical protein TQ32_10655 [Pyrococcus kukulkanii]